MNRVGYGAMQLAGPNGWGLPADPESVEWADTFFDPANAYGPRRVNQLSGEALRPSPDDVIFGNKVGAGRGPTGRGSSRSPRHRPPAGPRGPRRPGHGGE